MQVSIPATVITEALAWLSICYLFTATFTFIFNNRRTSIVGAFSPEYVEAFKNAGRRDVYLDLANESLDSS
jgi:hypothetical protein